MPSRNQALAYVHFQNTKMSSSAASLVIGLLMVLVISVAILMSSTRVEAIRILTEDFARANHLSASYDRIKDNISTWIESLEDSGPSPKGPGH